MQCGLWSNLELGERSLFLFSLSLCSSWLSCTLYGVCRFSHRRCEAWQDCVFIWYWAVLKITTLWMESWSKCEWWSIPCIIPVCSESCSWIYYSLPCLVRVSWPSLTHTCLGGGRTRKCLHLSAICSENRLRLSSGSHPVSGFEDNTAHSNRAIYFNISKYGNESIKAVQPNMTYKCYIVHSTINTDVIT